MSGDLANGSSQRPATTDGRNGWMNGRRTEAGEDSTGKLSLRESAEWRRVRTQYRRVGAGRGRWQGSNA